MTTITAHAVVAATGDQISTEPGAERVLLHPETGQYHGLSDVANSIWEAVQGPAAVADIHERLLAEYAVDAEECHRDPVAFIEELVAAELVTVE